MNMTMNSIANDKLDVEIKKNLPALINLLKLNGVKSAWLFGSAASANLDHESDIDILVNLKDGLDPAQAGENLWKLQENMVELFNRNVDLLTERSIKNPFFKEEINKTRIKIYG